MPAVSDEYSNTHTQTDRYADRVVYSIMLLFPIYLEVTQKHQHFHVCTCPTLESCALYACENVDKCASSLIEDSLAKKYLLNDKL